MICRKCKQEVADGLYCCVCGTKQQISQRAAKRRGNGQGSVYRRGNTWTAQVTSYIYETNDGETLRRKQKYLRKGGFTTKRDAISYLERLRSGKHRKAPTLIELYTVWQESDMPKLSRNKQIAYQKARERLEPIIGRKIDTLTTVDLQSVVNEQSTSYYVAKDMKVLLSHLYKRAVADQFVSINLSQFITLPKLEEKESVPFSEIEVQKMWKAFSDGDTFIGYLLLMIYSGMMPGELLSCQKAMIDFERREIYGCGKKTKIRKDNAIVFADIVLPVVKELIDYSPGKKLYNKHETKFYKDYHAATQRIGIRDLPPYSCRHTTGTEAARQNLNAATIQKIMRHAKITTSQKYIHFGTDDAHGGINKLPAKNQ